MPSADKELQLTVRREIARRNMDTSQLDVYANHGVVYLRGIVRALRGLEVDVDLNREMANIARVLRMKGVREVVNEAVIC